MGMACAGLIFALALASPSFAEEAEEGMVGIAFQALPEGAVVKSVRPSMGAEKAGVRVGDLVIAIDGESVAAKRKDATRQFRGPVGTSVRLTIQGPLNGAEREVEVERSKRVSIHRSDRMDPALARFRAAVRTEKSVAKAKEATEALVAAGFAGMSANEAVGTALSRAAKKQPKVARAALSILEKQALDDGKFRYRIGEAYYLLKDYAAAAVEFARSGELRGGDLVGSDYTTSVGTDVRRREMLVKSLVENGQMDEARKAAVALAPMRDIPQMWADVGLDSPAPRSPMTAHLPPMPSFETSLLEGGTWSSEEHSGKVVLLAFWATWCGPCKREMPELSEMWESLHDKPFELMAVSVDEGSSDKVSKTAKKWKMPFPVAHDRELGRKFDVSGLPAIRLLGPDGSMRFSGSGYSPTGVEKIHKRIDALLEELAAGDKGDGQRVGEVWTSGTTKLTGFSMVNGALSVAAAPNRVLVGTKGSAPVALSVVDGVLDQEQERDVSTQWTGLDGQVIWFDGAVGAKPGGLWLRAFDPEGTQRWLSTLPSPLVRLAVSGTHLWLAMEEGLAVVDGTGKVVASHDINAHDIADAGDGSIWAVDGTTRYRVTIDGISASDAAPDSAAVDGAGAWGRKGVRQLIEGRFGPSGALRKIAVRRGDVLTGLDGEGKIAFTMNLEADPVIAASDLNGDGQDELLVTIQRHGVITVQLEIP